MGESLRVEQGKAVEIDIVEGDLTIGDGSGIKPKSGDKITVKGVVEFEGNCEVPSSLEAGSVEGEKGRVHIQGDLVVQEVIDLGEGELTVDGQLQAKNIDIGRRLTVKRNLLCEALDIGGSLEVGGDFEAVEVSVGGTVSAQGNLKARKLEVGGSTDVKGLADLDKLDVGGIARVGGGRIDRVSVGGTFESSGKLSFKEVDVGGTVKLAAGEGGGKISAGGTLEVDGSLEFGEIDVGGYINIKGLAKGKKVDVGGKMKTGDNLTIEEALKVGGSVEVKGELSAGNIGVGGSLKANICSANEITVGGEVKTEEGAKVKKFEIGRRGKVKGPIVAERVKVNDGAEVEDVYVDRLEMDRNSVARNVYAREVKLGPSSRVSGELLYTERLELAEGTRVGSEPRKVEKLPKPPI